MNVRVAILLAAVMISVMAIAAPAFAQTGAQGSTPTPAQATSVPGSSGTPLKVETSTSRLSGKVGQYVRLTARITNTSGKPVKDVIAYVSLVETTRGQQASAG
jgi:hypothetical protein